MVLACALAFPLTDAERAAARALEARIDAVLRDAVRGEQAPVFSHPALWNERMLYHLITQYALAGWTVGSQPGRLTFAPNMTYLAHHGPEVRELIQHLWKY